MPRLPFTALIHGCFFLPQQVKLPYMKISWTTLEQSVKNLRSLPCVIILIILYRTKSQVSHKYQISNTEQLK